MVILSIETSCDETSIALIEAEGSADAPEIKVLGHALYSQVKTHAQYGGVFPMMAKREHAKNFVPILKSALEQSEIPQHSQVCWGIKNEEIVRKLLEREPEATESMIDFLSKCEKPKIDAIAVTVGPGLEPALWVGIQCAETLARVWNIPLYGVNHMEGHIFSAWLGAERTPKFPLLALLVSGGHTQLVKSDSAGKYTLLGETRDDASGEAFDKIARILGLPYPGGPEISRLAQIARNNDLPKIFTFPRPMIHTPDFDLSFSGLKTHVLYTTQKHGELTENERKDAAREAEDAICDVLVAKTRRAIENYPDIKTLIVAGGVASNEELRKRIKKLGEEMDMNIAFPTRELSTDNAVMIGIAAFVRIKLGDAGRPENTQLKARGRLALSA